MMFGEGRKSQASSQVVGLEVDATAYIEYESLTKHVKVHSVA